MTSTPSETIETAVAAARTPPRTSYENAPCGHLSTLPDGTIAKINATLLGWLGYTRDELVGRRRFTDLLTVGGRIYHETHFAPLLQMQGEVGGMALEHAARPTAPGCRCWSPRRSCTAIRDGCRC